MMPHRISRHTDYISNLPNTKKILELRLSGNNKLRGVFNQEQFISYGVGISARGRVIMVCNDDTVARLKASAQAICVFRDLISESSLASKPTSYKILPVTIFFRKPMYSSVFLERYLY